LNKNPEASQETCLYPLQGRFGSPDPNAKLFTYLNRFLIEIKKDVNPVEYKT
jgi:hypothetical protein